MGEYRILDYFNPKTREDLMDEEKIYAIVFLTTGDLQFQSIRNFEESAKAAGLLVKHRIDLHDKIRPFAVQSLNEDLQKYIATCLPLQRESMICPVCLLNRLLMKMEIYATLNFKICLRYWVVNVILYYSQTVYYITQCMYWKNHKHNSKYCGDDQEMVLLRVRGL